MDNLENKLFLAINQILEKTDMSVLNVKIDKGRLDHNIKIIIDSDNGINIDNCAHVSRLTTGTIKINKLVDGNFNLEVSSPGINRQLFKLEDYLSFVGENVKIQLKSPENKQKNFSGKIIKVKNNYIVVEVDNINKEIDFDNIKKANIVKI
ncbi:MAG: hypothetical protein VYE31_02445 [Pseudomonadota bacterium]|nr:hypothetical protein [Pseudomonadota bacterium]